MLPGVKGLVCVSDGMVRGEGKIVEGAGRDVGGNSAGRRRAPKP